jgi:hypothetical protein
LEKEIVMEKWIGWSLLALVVLCVVVVGSVWYDQMHRVECVGDGVEVRVQGMCWFQSKDPDGFGSNRFFASNEFGGGHMTMHPKFTVVNTSDEIRSISVRSLSGWEVPYRETLELAPGESHVFHFEAKEGCEWWYCWVNPAPLQI